LESRGEIDGMIELEVHDGDCHFNLILGTSRTPWVSTTVWATGHLWVGRKFGDLDGMVGNPQQEDENGIPNYHIAHLLSPLFLSSKQTNH
jgi:hypothetical protein